jgi:hypothetical protein
LVVVVAGRVSTSLDIVCEVAGCVVVVDPVDCCVVACPLPEEED